MESINKQCERCNNLFECKPHDIANCGCSTINLNDAASQFLQATYTDCVCPDCLRTIQQLHEHE